MPIDIQEFERGEAVEREDENSFEAKAERFLRENPGNAYTLRELGKATGYWEEVPAAHRKPSLETIDHFEELQVLSYRLESMEKQGRIRSNLVRIGTGHETFWAAK